MAPSDPSPFPTRAEEEKVPAGRAQPPRGHPSLGHPAATSPTDTGAMTATSRQAKSSSWSRVQDEGRGQAAGRAGRLWQDPLLPAGWVGLPSPLSGSQPRTSCCHHDALRRRAAAPRPAPRGHGEQLRAEPFPGKTGLLPGGNEIRRKFTFGS